MSNLRDASDTRVSYTKLPKTATGTKATIASGKVKLDGVTTLSKVFFKEAPFGVKGKVFYADSGEVYNLPFDHGLSSSSPLEYFVLPQFTDLSDRLLDSSTGSGGGSKERDIDLLNKQYSQKIHTGYEAVSLELHYVINEEDEQNEFLALADRAELVVMQLYFPSASLRRFLLGRLRSSREFLSTNREVVTKNIMFSGESGITEYIGTRFN